MLLTKHWILFTLLLLLTACTSITPPPSQPTALIPWKKRESSLNQLQSWQLNGKIAIQTARDAGSANVDWTQHDGQYQISLYGPLGVGGMKLSGQPGEAHLETANGKQFSAKSPEQLLAEQSGWHLPVSQLIYWIRGLPAPNAPYTHHFDTYQRLSNLQQQGWNIQFLSYTAVHGIDLPTRITITSSTFKAKVVIHDWKVN